MVRTTSWISRRTALRGAGAVVSLPWLEAMGPRMAWAEGGTAETAAPNRMAFLYAPRSEERRVGKECRSRWSPYH